MPSVTELLESYLVRQQPVALGIVADLVRLSRAGAAAANRLSPRLACDRRSAGPGHRGRQRQRRRHRQDAIRHLARRPAETARPQGRHRHARLSRQGHRVAARRRGRQRSARGRRRARAARAPYRLPRRCGSRSGGLRRSAARGRARRRRAVRRRACSTTASGARSRSPSWMARAAWATGYVFLPALCASLCRGSRKSMRSWSTAASGVMPACFARRPSSRRSTT